MNVLLVSQCHKNALKETRRTLDQFAERRGERTWQTSITLEGLSTLRRLLRKKARKNTAVACHWIRGQNHSELMWVVGDAGRFNQEGAVPTDTTQRNVLRAGDENDWHCLEVIRLLSHLAGLLHDLGKASVAFQKRLDGQWQEKNRYRHEWVSLRLWQAFVGEDDDVGWLARLANAEQLPEKDWLAAGRYQQDGIDAQDRYPFKHLPPLAAAVGWLVVTHHRLPVVPVKNEEGIQEWLGKPSKSDVGHWLEQPLVRVAHDSNEKDSGASEQEARPYWQMAAELPVTNPQWCKAAAKVAKSLQSACEKYGFNWLDNPYVMHLSRLCLMLSDHYYSSLGQDERACPDPERGRFLQKDQTLMANTLKLKSGKRVANQSLLEHLLGVGSGAAMSAHALPGFERYLPRLANHRGLKRRTKQPKFSWQNRAYDTACAVRETARRQGAFIINMASTGCGKTIANARLVYALANQQEGMRATYALGLRTLTLQTGKSYREDLRLDEDELAIQVGGTASRELFDYYQRQAEASGSASAQDLLEEDSHVLYEGNHADHPLLGRALSNPAISKLISAPLLVSTVDHLMPATEALRAGRQIAPMLRLMSSDLILDELDDYGIEDLPALTRLMYWTGLLGGRVVLSSATLPPALVEGMFLAYQAGRRHYANNRGEPDAREAGIPVIWVDEFTTDSTSCLTRDDFSAAHQAFIDKRVAKLIKAPALRQAELLPVTVDPSLSREDVQTDYAHQIQAACLQLHHAHSNTDTQTAKQVSFGLVRMANIEPLVAVARELFRLPVPDDVRIHLCVYHSRFPLLQRSAIENQLDTAFNRRDEGGQAVFKQLQIRSLLDKSSEKHHVFVVLASPVCEVGRDWDADWAVVEPSSMRSLIQLAGRVQRHRQRVPNSPNLLIFDSCLKYLTKPSSDQAFFARPGFEANGEFRLEAHRLSELLTTEEYGVLTAIPRVYPRAEESRRPQHSLVDLEQARLAKAMLPIEMPAKDAPEKGNRRQRGRKKVTFPLERETASASWQKPRAMLTGVLPQQQPFRENNSRAVELVFLPNEEETELKLHRVESVSGRRGDNLYVPAESQCQLVKLDRNKSISCWGEQNLLTLLEEQAEAQNTSIDYCAKRMAKSDVLASGEGGQGWEWHPWLGFSLAK